MVQSSAELVKIVMPKVHEGLVARGWKKALIRRMYFTSLNQDVIGIVHLTRVAGRTAIWVDVDATVAVRHQPLEKKLAEIMGEPFRQYDPGTLATHLGYIMPQGRLTTWAFTPETHIPTRLTEMLDAIEEFGLPFMRKHSTLDAIVKSMESGEFTVDILQWFRLPVAYHILGENALAKKFVEERLQEMKNYKFMLEDQFRKFARNLQPYVDGSER